MECADTDTAKSGAAVDELQKALTHHICEEEQAILNPARRDVDDATRLDSLQVKLPPES